MKENLSALGKIRKNILGNGNTVIYKIKFIDTCRFMQSKWSDIVDSLSEIKECEFIGVKDDRLHYKCKEYGKRFTKSKNGLI